ncbi:outer membrane lipoprotein-sorting protein [Candidatus Margulisiibacteriota bacterium]
MKRTILILFCVLLMAVPVLAKEKGKTEDLNVHDILVKMENAGDYETSTGTAVMKIVDREGNETKMELEMYEKRGSTEADDDKSLMRFTYPARLKGTAILMVGDNIWYYNNRTNRVRLLSQSAKKGSMMGSSFSYEDMSAQYAEDYTGEIIKDERDHYILKLFPKDEDVSYKYLIVKVRKDDYIPVNIGYYNDDELKYKEMKSENIKKIDGRTVPLTVSMNDIEESKITYFDIDEKAIKYDVDVDDKMFSERHLKK